MGKEKHGIMQEARRLRENAQRVLDITDLARAELRGRIDALEAIETFGRSGHTSDPGPIAGAEDTA